ncbi:MAG TPA: 2-oxoglutarate and iron-dependent oxygenase domain-containing protein [Thermoanaerobaculia bacterium]|nr:2-oxoglutarate and iron-dependent oxygenase domain-containing protein [Thermoanaerobaculia bacterium]
MATVRTIPTIDLSDYTAGGPDTRSALIRTLGDGLREFGFLNVEGHGIDSGLIRSTYDLWQRYFELPEEVKRQYSGIEGGARGFTPFGIEHAKGRTQADLKEFWHVGQDDPPEGASRQVYPPNVWPQEIPELREPTLRLYKALERVAENLLVALAEYFDLPKNTFAGMMGGGQSILRVIHYPALEGAPEPGAVRAAEHEDINLITLLCEATEAGLEILTREGDWLPVQAAPGQIVVDAGDMLSRCTNEVVPATTHRVVNPPDSENRDRYSMPFFVHPRPEVDLTVMDRFVTDDRPAKFPPITAGQFLEQRLREIGLKK